MHEHAPKLPGTMARLIKRYENRKLYDTEASAYVSLADVAALVRRGETVEVIDKATGKDLTAQILTQIILEEGKHGQSAISTEVLLFQGAQPTELAQLRDQLNHLEHLLTQALGEQGQAATENEASGEQDGA